MVFIIKIRIEPDWNVKSSSLDPKSEFDMIRIEPDWNVKYIE